MSAASAAGGGSGPTKVTISSPSGNPAALISLADQLDQHADSVTTLGTTVEQTTSGIAHQAEWTGTAAASYTTFCNATSTSIGNLAPPLHQIAAAIRTYASELSTAQHSVETAVHSANSAAHSEAQALQTAAEHAASTAASTTSNAAVEAVKLITAAQDALDKVMEATEPVREWIEKVHLPWDLGGGLAWEKTMMKNAEEDAGDADKFVKNLKKLDADWYEDVNEVALEADRGGASWGDVTEALARWTSKTDAAKAFGDQWLESAEALVGKLKWVGRGMGALSLIGDASTLWDPEDDGALGWVDRSAAIINGVAVTGGMVLSSVSATAFVSGLVGANSLDWVPVAGEVVMVADVATGLYLGADYVVHHWAGISHGAEKAASVVGHATTSLVHDGGHLVSDVTSWL
jgi:uncharacterized protein YukE